MTDPTPYQARSAQPGAAPFLRYHATPNNQDPMREHRVIVEADAPADAIRYAVSLCKTDPHLPVTVELERTYTPAGRRPHHQLTVTSHRSTDPCPYGISRTDRCSAGPAGHAGAHVWRADR